MRPLAQNPRNRKHTERGRTRLFNEAIHALRMRVERTFAWEETFKRLLLRFERFQQRHYGMKLMAYTLINLREFCRTYNLRLRIDHAIRGPLLLPTLHLNAPLALARGRARAARTPGRWR